LHRSEFVINDILIKIWEKYAKEKKKKWKILKVEKGERGSGDRQIFKKRIELCSPHFYLVLKGGILNQHFSFLHRL
jgi:hypothetical protein